MKVILITGTSKGIGKYLAEYYLKKGFIVAGCSRGQATITDTHYRHFTADITQEGDVVSMCYEISREFGRLDVLINNAGVASMNAALLTPYDTAKRILAINTLGVFLAARESAKIMMRHKWGRIVNLSTIAVPLGVEGEALYAASKSAVETFTRIMAREVAKFGITCNAVGPAPIQTDLIKNVPETKIRALVDRLAVKRLGKYEDVANVADFFIKEESDYITGQIVYLGGA